MTTGKSVDQAPTDANISSTESSTENADAADVNKATNSNAAVNEANVNEGNVNEAAVNEAKASNTTAAKEYGGPKGPEPTRYGDWEKNGRCSDF